MNNQQLHALNGFVAGTVHAGLEGGLYAKSATQRAVN